jgi:hypothetical protein
MICFWARGRTCSAGFQAQDRFRIPGLRHYASAMATVRMARRHALAHDERPAPSVPDLTMSLRSGAASPANMKPCSISVRSRIANCCRCAPRAFSCFTTAELSAPTTALSATLRDGRSALWRRPRRVRPSGVGCRHRRGAATGKGVPTGTPEITDGLLSDTPSGRVRRRRPCGIQHGYGGRGGVARPAGSSQRARKVQRPRQRHQRSHSLPQCARRSSNSSLPTTRSSDSETSMPCDRCRLAARSGGR